MLNERILCAGFGGQGVMSIGQLLAYAGMTENKHVTWIPSYGPEMRGGTAYCNVVLSDREVGSPIVTTNASCAIIMNLPSLLKFEKSVIPGGTVIINSSLINKKSTRTDINSYYVTADELANLCGNQRAANIVMLGAYIALMQPVDFDTILEVLPKVFGERPERFTTLNRDALLVGADAVLGVDHRLEAA